MASQPHCPNKVLMFDVENIKKGPLKARLPQTQDTPSTKGAKFIQDLYGFRNRSELACLALFDSTEASCRISVADAVGNTAALDFSGLNTEDDGRTVCFYCKVYEAILGELRELPAADCASAVPNQGASAGVLGHSNPAAAGTSVAGSVGGDAHGASAAVGGPPATASGGSGATKQRHRAKKDRSLQSDLSAFRSAQPVDKAAACWHGPQ